MSQSLGDWMKSERELPSVNINGQELLNRTVDKISLSNTVEGAQTGGCLVTGGIIWIVGTVGGFPILMWCLYLFAEGQLDTACWILGIVGVAVILYIMYASGTPTREARQLYVSPGPASLIEIKEVGAREASGEEISLLKSHLERIIDHGGSYLKAPDYWMIDHRPGISSFIVGNTLFLKNQALQSQFLGALVAYELVRISNGDGRIKVALKRLGIPQSELPNASEWRAFWRQQVFKADEMVAKFGYANELMMYLDWYQPAEIAKSYYEQEEPYLSERKMRLKKLMGS